MDLIALLGEDLAKQVSEKLGDEYDIYNKKNGDMIPKAKFNEKIAELKDLKTQFDSINSKIADLDKFTNENTELKTQLDKIKQDNEAFKLEADKRLLSEKKRFLGREGLLSLGADKEYIDFLESKIDYEKMELDNEKLIGLADKANSLRDTYKKMFNETIYSGTGAPDRGGKTPSKDFFTQEQVDKMSDKEVMQNIDKINESMKSWR